MKLVRNNSYSDITVTQLKDILTELETKGMGNEKVYVWRAGYGFKPLIERYSAFKDEEEKKDGVFFE